MWDEAFPRPDTPPRAPFPAGSRNPLPGRWLCDGATPGTLLPLLGHRIRAATPRSPGRSPRRRPPTTPEAAMEINLTTVATIWMIGSLAMVPVLGVTIRFAIVPFINSVARLRSVDARLSAIEEKLDRMNR